ncbi:MAG TPA: 3-isopropylmalate dehydratase small subunit [Fontimonas sp.]
MTPFTTHTGIAAPLLRINVDTDAIIPSREMKTVGKRGLADGLFAGWRYVGTSGREPDPDFVLNQPRYAGASILLSGANFGCGSSREHAVWALAEFGIRCIVAPSFGTIFHGNCMRNGLLPVVLRDAQVAALAAQVEGDPQQNRLTIDLAAQQIVAADGSTQRFEIDANDRMMLLEGLDAIGLTLKDRAAIDAHVARDREQRPWAYLRP